MVGSIPEEIDYKKWSYEETSTWIIENINYLYALRKSNKTHIYTLWIAIDLHLQSGRKLLKEALDYLVKNSFL